ncbi:MAG: carboxypeptidase regulatory-like domain-containing protein, partial [Acidobacteriaceae bacterium]|nr:carboxypeptidase regulatory-like domain-containing protein [Acidobacteriaceae bacterium]
MRGNWYWLTALLVFASLRSGSAQVADKKCVVEGTASDAITGEVLRKVVVELGSWYPSNIKYQAVTDASGRFHFEAIPPGEYRLR